MPNEKSRKKLKNRYIFLLWENRNTTYTNSNAVECGNIEILLTLNSNAAIPIPEAAAVPAIPTKWPDPILLANNDAPSCNF